ncbi:MAG: hypothetical protein ACYC8T_34110 [Myxococcaceae bacterium]
MTQADAALAQKAREVPPGSLRHTVLLSARRFKSTWVELGKLLIQVRDEALFEGWGFESFETYCARELHIRKSTADKLTRSFSFLAKHDAKEVQAGDIAERAPAFEVVEVLADAEQRGQLSSQEYKSIRDSIWNPQQPVSELKRELVDRFPRPAPEPPAEAVLLRRLAASARRLATELAAHKKVPKAIAERAGALAEDVEELSGAKA